jgi:RNA polymerase sigma-70 factor (ECF subfamily)
MDDLNVVIDQVLRGEGDAFLTIVRHHGLSLRAFIASQIHARDDVDDLAQEVFLVAYRNLRDFKRGEDFGAWLRGIARNKVYHHFRNTARRNLAVGRFREEVSRLIEERLERAFSTHRSGTIEVLLHCVGLLPERMRRVVRGGLDGDDPSEIAEELGTTVGAVYSLHYRANQLLRDCVRKELA